MYRDSTAKLYKIEGIKFAQIDMITNHLRIVTSLLNREEVEHQSIFNLNLNQSNESKFFFLGTFLV